MRQGWNPWRALRDDHAGVLLFHQRLPPEVGGGVAFPRHVAIVLCDSLNQVERNAVLAHELVHLERDGVCDHPDAPEAWAPVVLREERWTDDESVRRLVPMAELRDFCCSREPIGCIEPWHVAEEFHVTERVAERALVLLGKGEIS